MCSRRREWCLALELLLLPHWFLATSIQGTFHELSACDCVLRAWSGAKRNMACGSTLEMEYGLQEQILPSR